MSLRDWLPGRIPTFIPVSWRRRWARFWSASLVDRVWQLFLTIVGGAIIYAALTSGYAFITAIAGIVISIVLADDIKSTIQNVWNREFWVFKP